MSGETSVWRAGRCCRVFLGEGVCISFALDPARPDHDPAAEHEARVSAVLGLWLDRALPALEGHLEASGLPLAERDATASHLETLAIYPLGGRAARAQVQLWLAAPTPRERVDALAAPLKEILERHEAPPAPPPPPPAEPPPPPRRQRRWLWWLVLLLVPLPLRPLLVQVIGHGIVGAPNRGQPAPADPDPLPPEGRALRAPVAPPRAEILLWVLDPPTAPRGTVLLLHGIRAGKGQLRGLGEQLRQRGFRVVLPDLRGHGGSSGDALSYGVHESHDLALVLDRLAQEQLLQPPVAAVGFSYGGSVALQLAARDPRVRAVVAVATFADLHTVARRYVHRALPPLSWLITEGMLQEGMDLARRLGRFDPAQASSVRAAAQAQTRRLLLHGAADQHIPPEHSRAIHAAAPERGPLIVLPDLDHNTVFRSPLTREHIVRFLEEDPGASGRSAGR